MGPTNVLLLQETEMEEEYLIYISRESRKKQGGYAVSSRGASGGLATLWNKNGFSLLNFFSTQRWIFTELQHLPSKISIALFNLYVLVHYMEKRECWNTFNRLPRDLFHPTT